MIHICCLHLFICQLLRTYVDMWSLTLFFFLSFVFSRIRKWHFSVLGVRCHFTCRTTVDRPGRSQFRILRMWHCVVSVIKYVQVLEGEALHIQKFLDCNRKKCATHRACDTYRRGNQVNRKPDIRCMSAPCSLIVSVAGYRQRASSPSMEYSVHTTHVRPAWINWLILLFSAVAQSN